MPACGSGGVLPVGWRNVTLWDRQPKACQHHVLRGEVGKGGLAGWGQEEPVRMIYRELQFCHFPVVGSWASECSLSQPQLADL